MRGQPFFSPESRRVIIRIRNCGSRKHAQSTSNSRCSHGGAYQSYTVKIKASTYGGITAANAQLEKTDFYDETEDSLGSNAENFASQVREELTKREDLLSGLSWLLAYVCNYSGLL